MVDTHSIFTKIGWDKAIKHFREWALERVEKVSHKEEEAHGARLGDDVLIPVRQILKKLNEMEHGCQD